VLIDFNPAETLRLIETERVTLVNFVATMAALMLASRAFRSGISLRCAVSYSRSMFPRRSGRSGGADLPGDL